MSQPFRAGLKSGYRPYGPESDLRYIFEFSHRLSRAGLKFGRRPYGPRERMRSLLRFSPLLKQGAPTTNLDRSDSQPSPFDKLRAGSTGLKFGERSTQANSFAAEG
jgi:hypothetical protein